MLCCHCGTNNGIPKLTPGQGRKLAVVHLPEATKFTNRRMVLRLKSPVWQIIMVEVTLRVIQNHHRRREFLNTSEIEMEY